MKTLTLDAIRENPWNVITHALPARPGQVLLEAACLAALYCHRSEFALMLAARAGRYVPSGWDAIGDWPDIHEESEARALEALDRLGEIQTLYETAFGCLWKPPD